MAADKDAPRGVCVAAWRCETREKWSRNQAQVQNTRDDVTEPLPELDAAEEVWRLSTRRGRLRFLPLSERVAPDPSAPVPAPKPPLEPLEPVR